MHQRNTQSVWLFLVQATRGQIATIVACCEHGDNLDDRGAQLEVERLYGGRVLDISADTDGGLDFLGLGNECPRNLFEQGYQEHAYNQPKLYVWEQGATKGTRNGRYVITR